LPSGTSCSPTTAGARAFIVGYLAKKPKAGYITAQQGALANAGRNTLKLPRINNLDVALLKRVSFTERLRFEFGAQLLNALNHPQFVAGLLNDIRAFGNLTDAARNGFLNPASTSFLNASSNFNSNARTISLSAKFIF